MARAGHQGRPFRAAECADHVAGVLDALGIDAAVVAGYSLGGAVDEGRAAGGVAAGPAACGAGRRDRLGSRGVPEHRLAASIPAAQVFDAPGGHASIVLDHDRWAPVFLAAVADVTTRVPSPRRMVG